MDREKRFNQDHIEKVLTENFIDLMPSFYEMQSTFLSGVYKRYGDLEGGNIVIFFARDLHLEILRKREEDLGFNLSLDNFCIIPILSLSTEESSTKKSDIKPTFNLPILLISFPSILL